MELAPPPAARPAEYLLRAHLAHADHHELLAEGQAVRLAEAASGIGAAPAESRSSSSKPRRRRKQ